MKKHKKLLKDSKFNKWAIIEQDVTKNTTHYICKCECGNIVSVSLSNLKYGGSKQCKECSSKDKIGLNNPYWKGYGKIPGQHWGHIKHDAKKRGIKFNITIEYIWNLFLKQNGRCAFSGIELVFKKCDNLQTASLDRIDSSKGYIKGNVQWIHKKFQSMKFILSNEEFIKNCSEVYLYRNK